jgi:tRNA (mo5U34)-methyltransferase
MARSQPDRDALLQRVADIEGWYHAIDFGDGIRTPGPFDMAAHLDAYGLPERMDDMRVLDVGCANGFFAIEFEKRGAREVIAVDVPSWLAKDWSPAYAREYVAKRTEVERDAIDSRSLRAAFELVVEVLGRGRIRREELSVYDVDPDRLGTFDFVFCASMLMHVRDPLLALHRLRTVCRDDGEIVVSISSPPALQADGDDPIARFVGTADQCNFWQMSAACLRRMLACCDFKPVDAGSHFVLSDQPTAQVISMLAEAEGAIDVHAVPGSGEFRDPHYVCHARPLRH